MFQENVPLAGFSSYKIGGPARYFFEAKNIEELKRAVEKAGKENLKIFILGGGTNVLFGDEGFDGLVLRPAFGFMKRSDGKVSAGAGVLMSDLVNFAIENELGGLEWAGGLPGTLGGAIRGNAGAFKGEIKDVIESVKSFDIRTLNEIERNFQECCFGYRSSVFKNDSGKEIIVSAVLNFSKGDKNEIKKSVEEKISYRKERHPMESPNVGSIFKNIPVSQIDADIEQIDADTIRVNPRLRPASDGQARSSPRLSAFTAPVKSDPFPVVPAAFIISEAGLKGVRSGNAMVSPKHPNFIVNTLDAKASDVKNLINLVKNEVKKKFGIELEEEIIFA